MTFFVDGKQQADFSDADKAVVCFAAWDEAAAVLPRMGFEPEHADAPMLKGATRFESHAGYDFFFLSVPVMQDLEGEAQKAAVWFSGGRLLVAAQPMEAVQKLQQDLAAWQGEAPPPEGVFYRLFSGLFVGDASFLDGMEEEISQMEDGAMQDQPRDCTEQLSTMRKNLLVLKRYYEALFDALEDLEENQNGFFSKGQLRYFRMHTNRADRLSRTVLNLRDYLTQVREAFQNQLDISLNKTMKLFTVITAIFLPLTLVAGWYGMNLQMPEYGYAWTYPVVIALSIAVVVGCIWYFKKHKWF